MRTRIKQSASYLSYFIIILAEKLLTSSQQHLLILTLDLDLKRRKVKIPERKKEILSSLDNDQTEDSCSDMKEENSEVIVTLNKENIS